MRLILFVADMLHPICRVAVEPLLDCNVGHGRGRRGAVPVLFTGRDPYHVAWPNLLDRPAPTLHASAARRHDQRLAKWMRMPGGSGAGLERHTRPGHTSRIGRTKQ